MDTTQSVLAHAPARLRVYARSARVVENLASCMPLEPCPVCTRPLDDALALAWLQNEFGSQKPIWF